MKGKIFSIIGIVSGAVSIVFSFVVLSFEYGSWMNFETYGGDAYTGMQNAAARTAQNVQYLAYMVRFGLFALLFVGGIVIICYFANSLVRGPVTSALVKMPAEIDEAKLPDL